MTFTDPIAPVPRSVAVVEYGLPAALWLAAKQSGAFDLLLSSEWSSPSSPSPAHFLLLAAFDRLCRTKKDTEIAEWYGRSILHSLWRFGPDDFALEKFRDCFEQISVATNPDPLKTIQSGLLGLWPAKNLVSERLFAYDQPGFYTYIASSDEPRPSTGQSVRAGGESNIRRVGVSYVLDVENGLSLCHQVYDGKAPGAEPFSAGLSRINKMLDRYQLPRERVTLVSGKSSAALAHINELEAAGLGWIFALTWNQTPEDFRARPMDQLHRCDGAGPGIRVVAERMRLYGKEHLCMLRHSASFQARQVEKLTISLNRATQYLRYFARQLRDSNTRVSGAQARNWIQGWLSDQYLAELVEYQLQDKDGRLQLEFEVNGNRLQWLLNHQLGRTFLLTNRLDWGAEELERSFSAQEMVENVFSGLHHEGNSVGWSGPGSWSEADLRVHTFYCMLAVSLLQLMYKPVREIWPEVTLDLLLEELHEIKQFVLVYSSAEAENSSRVATVLSELTVLQQALAQVIGINQL